MELSEYFDESTLRVARERLLIKLDKGVWNHYVLRLEVDTEPDKCEGEVDGCEDDCWMCDRTAPWLTMWADPINDPDNSECINDEFCFYTDDLHTLQELATREYGDGVEMYGVRHGDSDWTLGIQLGSAGMFVNRVGWVLSIPRPTPDMEKNEFKLCPKCQRSIHESEVCCT